MQTEESPNAVFIKGEVPFEYTPPLSGIVYVQPDEQYYIKCNHCEINFELIENFTKHCVENHFNTSINSPTVENLSENWPLITQISEEITHDNEFSNEDPFMNNDLVKKEIDECIKNQEGFINFMKLDNQQNIKNEDQNSQDKEVHLKNCQRNGSPTIEVSHDLKCQICQKQLMSRSGFLRHIKRQKCGLPTVVGNITPFKCGVCNKEFTKSKLLKNHEIRHQKTDIFTCTHCKTEFRHEKTFLSHLKIHSETEKAHKCEICSKVFRTNYNLKSHRIIVHSTEPFYKCNQCSKSFRSRYKYREHKSEFHNGPQKHKCQYCPKAFRSLSYLEVHERVHTGEKPYQCEVCGKSFAAFRLLTLHNKRHTNERNFKCDICGKCFFTGTYLRDHMVTHTKIKSISCEICNARFTLRSALSKHRKLHSEVKEYVCKLCGKAYAQGPGLYAHMKTHKVAQESIIL